jgi:CRP-like cAMP-binding protein
MHCLIGQLPRVRQERLDPCISEVEFRKGDVLQAEGIDTDVVRIIKLGTVMLSRQGPDGVARPVAIVGRGELLGQWRLLDQPTQVGAVALSIGRVCELPVEALRGPLLQDPQFRAVLHGGMAQSFARLADWSQLMRLRGLPRQLVAALLLLGEAQGTSAVRLPSHVALATLLNTTRESVARTLRQLELAGHLRRIDRWHAELGRGHRAVFGDGGDTP